MSDEELLANIYTRLITEKVSYRVVCKWGAENQEKMFKTYLELAKIATKVYSEDRAKGERNEH
jgi:hypothetical protein